MSLILRFLAFIGRYGTQGFAISIFLGLSLPQFAAAARPFLALSIFVFVSVTFSRIDLSALSAILRRPTPLIFALLWVTFAPIAMISGIFAVVGRENMDPGLVLGLALLAAAPPIMSSPAVAMLLGLAPTMLMAAVLVTTTFAPFFSPFVAELVSGAAVPLDVTVLVWRMVFLIGGAILAAAAIRLVLGERRIREHKASFDGIGVVMYAVFAIAAMDGVLAAMVETPARVLAFLGIAFAISLAGMFGTMLILRPVAPSDRFVLGYATGQRNMGLLVAALGAATPDTTFLFFALAQFPIYLMPQIIKPFAKRFIAPAVIVADRSGP